MLTPVKREGTPLVITQKNNNQENLFLKSAKKGMSGILFLTQRIYFSHLVFIDELCDLQSHGWSVSDDLTVCLQAGTLYTHCEDRHRSW